MSSRTPHNCPVCEAKGRTRDGEICPACKGTCVVWDVEPQEAAGAESDPLQINGL